MKRPEQLYFKGSFVLLGIGGVNLTEFKILLLVATFGKKGLKMGTDRIAEIIGRTPTHVSRSFTSLENKGLIRIEKKQSQYRRAYLTENTIPLQHTEQSGNNSTSTRRAESLKQGEQSTLLCRAESILIEGSKEEYKDADASESKINIPAPMEAFTNFWEQYPRKVGRLAALKAWTKLAPAETLVAEIMAALAKHKSQSAWSHDGGRYIPHGATWLNGRRWEDQIVIEQTPTDDDDLPTEEEVREIERRYREDDGYAATA